MNTRTKADHRRIKITFRTGGSREFQGDMRYHISKIGTLSILEADVPGISTKDIITYNRRTWSEVEYIPVKES